MPSSENPTPQAVAQVVPGDQRDDGVHPRVDAGDGELDLATVGAAHHADAGVVRADVVEVVLLVLLHNGERRGGLGVLLVGVRDAGGAAEVADRCMPALPSQSGSSSVILQVEPPKPLVVRIAGAGAVGVAAAGV